MILPQNDTLINRKCVNIRGLMKKITKQSKMLFTLIGLLLSMNVQAINPKSIISALGSKSITTSAQSAINIAKSHVSSLRAGAAATALTATVNASGYAPAIAQTAAQAGSMTWQVAATILPALDPTLITTIGYGALGATTTATYLGTIHKIRTNYFNQKILAQTKPTAQASNASTTKKAFPKNIYDTIALNPSQIKAAIDNQCQQVVDHRKSLFLRLFSLDRKWTYQEMKQDIPAILKKSLPCMIAYQGALEAGIRLGGQAFLDGVTYGTASIGAYAVYTLRQKAQKHLENLRDAQEPTTIFDLTREHNISDHLLEEPTQPTITLTAPPSNNPKN